MTPDIFETRLAELIERAIAAGTKPTDIVNVTLRLGLNLTASMYGRQLAIDFMRELADTAEQMPEGARQ